MELKIELDECKDLYLKSKSIKKLEININHGWCPILSKLKCKEM